MLPVMMLAGLAAFALAAPNEAPLPLAAAVNDASEALLGTERRFRFGPEGAAHFPALAGRPFAGLRFYLLPGLPWPGAPEQGQGWLTSWARGLRAAGASRAVAVRYAPADLWASCRLAGRPEEAIRRAGAAIAADLAAHPPAPGERVVLVGHSFGARLAAAAVPALAPWRPGLVLLGAALPEGALVKSLPREAAWALVLDSAGARTALPGARVGAPTHMGLVLAPEAEALRAIGAAAAKGLLARE